MAELDAALLEVKEQVTLERGRVAIATVPTLASDPLPQILVAYKRLFPGVTVNLVEEDASAVALRVEMGLADFGLMARPVRRTDLKFVPLAHDPFVALFPKGKGPEVGKSVSLRELLSDSFLTVTTGSSIRSILEQAAIREGLTFEPVHELTQHTTLVGMVKSGVGAAAIPALSLRMMDLSGVDIIPLVRPTLVRELGIVHRKGDHFSAAANEFVAEIGRHFLMSGQDNRRADNEATRLPRIGPARASKSKRRSR
jgi:LysR family carnitine catabolism transcriptional activator